MSNVVGNFADRVRTLRKGKKLTQAELAKAASISTLQIGRYESGEQLPRTETLERIATALDTTPEFLLGGGWQERLLEGLPTRPEWKRAGEKLKEFRAGRDAREIAKHAGIPFEHVIWYEGGVSIPSPETAGRLAAALGCKIEDFLPSDVATEKPGGSVALDYQQVKELQQEISRLQAEISRLERENNDLNGHVLEMRADPERFFMVSITGLAECGLNGWEVQTKTASYTAAPPDIYKGGKGFAVLAVGDSMIPAGIEPGFLVFCDPERTPLPGDIVYIEDTQGHGTIKHFAGFTKKRGVDFLIFEGWLPRDREHPDKPQKSYTLEWAASQVKGTYPVVYIKRRM